MKICCMQPYFLPHAAYFGLFATVDVFVVLDDVQFNRTGWVHRNKIEDRWLTLPIRKTDRDTTMIRGLEWPEHAQEMWLNRLRKFNMFHYNPLRRPTFLEAMVPILRGSPLSFICETLDVTSAVLDLRKPMVMSSSFRIDSVLKGEEKIIAICKSMGATEYYNTVGGVGLYDFEKFKKHDIRLNFLPAYNGSHTSIIERLHKEETSEIRKEILCNL